MLFGSTLFGILGALLAIPIAAAIQISIIEYNAFRNPPEIGAIQAPPPDEPPPPGAASPRPRPRACPTESWWSRRAHNGCMSGADLDELRLLRRARDQMDREYDRPLDVPALARTALMSTAHFSRRFREAYGETPYSYLMTRRIERAKALLRSGDVSVTEACFAVGCTSLGSFSSRFTEIVGETPSAYRARDHDDFLVVPGCQAMLLGRPRRSRV